MTPLGGGAAWAGSRLPRARRARSGWSRVLRVPMLESPYRSPDTRRGVAASVDVPCCGAAATLCGGAAAQRRHVPPPAMLSIASPAASPPRQTCGRLAAPGPRRARVCPPGTRTCASARAGVAAACHAVDRPRVVRSPSSACRAVSARCHTDCTVRLPPLKRGEVVMVLSSWRTSAQESERVVRLKGARHGAHQ